MDVSGMSQHAPRLILELVPLLEEVVPAMVTDPADQFSVGDRNFGQVGCVNNQFPPIRQHRLQFIHALPCDPQLVVHFGGAGENLPERFRFSDNVQLLG